VGCAGVEARAPSGPPRRIYPGVRARFRRIGRDARSTTGQSVVPFPDDCRISAARRSAPNVGGNAVHRARCVSYNRRAHKVLVSGGSRSPCQVVWQSAACRGRELHRPAPPPPPPATPPTRPPPPPPLRPRQIRAAVQAARARPRTPTPLIGRHIPCPETRHRAIGFLRASRMRDSYVNHSDASLGSRLIDERRTATAGRRQSGRALKFQGSGESPSWACGSTGCFGVRRNGSAWHDHAHQKISRESSREAPPEQVAPGVRRGPRRVVRQSSSATRIRDVNT
jgi:hypothetical protein